METLNFILSLTSLIIGLLCFSTILITALTVMNTFTLRALFFYAAYTLMMIITLVLNYIDIRDLLVGEAPGKIIVYTGLICNALFVFALPDYLDYLKKGKSAGLSRNLILIAAIIFLIAGLFSVYYAPSPGKIIGYSFPAILIPQAIFTVLIIYAFLPYKVKAGAPELKGEEKKFFDRFTIVGYLFLPGLAVDVLLNGIIPFRFYPLLYAASTVFYTVFLIRYVRARMNDSSHPSVNESVTGIPDISPREREVLILVLQGKSNREIADMLFISLPTVKTHVQKIFRKTGVSGRFELVRFLGESPIGRTD